jgi:hypothetical protein
VHQGGQQAGEIDAQARERVFEEGIRRFVDWYVEYYGVKP